MRCDEERSDAFVARAWFLINPCKSVHPRGIHTTHVGTLIFNFPSVLRCKQRGGRTASSNVQRESGPKTNTGDHGGGHDVGGLPQLSSQVSEASPFEKGETPSHFGRCEETLLSFRTGVLAGMHVFLRTVVQSKFCL